MVDEVPRSESPLGSDRNASLEEHSKFERVFEVSIDGPVAPALLAKLGDVEVSLQEMRTILTGRFRDQSEVYGFLERLRSYALEVVEVRRIGEGELPDRKTEGS
jgi:hypothetical protein